MVGTSTEAALLEPVEKAKKKLSFREPEIVGYYMMQMKQGVADRLSKRGKSTSSKNGVNKTASSPTKNRTFVNHGCSFAGDDGESRNKIPQDSNYQAAIMPASSAEDLSLDSQAMKVVRSVGQAFEQCHTNQQSSPTSPSSVFEYDDLETNETAITAKNFDTTSYDEQQPQCENEYQQNSNPTSSFHDDYNRLANMPRSSRDEQTTPRMNSLRKHANPDIDSSALICNSHINGESPLRQTHFTYSEPPITPLGVEDKTFSYNTPNDTNIAGMSMGAAHQIQLLKERLEQQSQQTQAAIAQMRLLQDQLNAETAARIEAQTRTYRLLANNKQLLDHIGSLVCLLQQREKLCPSQISRQQPHVQPAPHPSQLQYQNLLNIGAKTASLPRVGNHCTSANGFSNFLQQQYGNIPLSPTFPTASPMTAASFNLDFTPIEVQHRVQNHNTNDLQQQQQQQEQLRQIAELYHPQSLLQQNSINNTTATFQNYPSTADGVSDVNTRTNVVHKDDAHLIKPLSQGDTIMETDTDGRVRRIMPVNDEETRTGHRKDQNDTNRSRVEISSTPSIRRINKAGDRQKYEKTNSAVGDRKKEGKTNSSAVDTNRCNGNHYRPLEQTSSIANASSRRRKEEPSTTSHLSPQPIITRTTSEKAPKRSQLLLEVQRNAWTRHTTK